MKNITKKLSLSCLFTALILSGVSCSSSSSSDDNENEGADETSVTILGNISTPSPATARFKAGVTGVTVSALGSSDTSDEGGNFTLSADGAAFAGGAVEFAFSGQGLDTTAVLEGVPGGPGAVAQVNFVVEDDGQIIGESIGPDGAVLGTTPGAGLKCDVTRTFSDGGGGALWKPHAEKTGTVVILMPAEYRNASVEILNNRNESVTTPILRDCCQHNGGREHIYLRHTAGNLANSGTPLTVRFVFPDGFTDCRTVPNPNQRYD